MREILFRGRALDKSECAYGKPPRKGEWVYGNLITDTEDDDVYILTQENLRKGIDIGGWIDGAQCYVVIPDTVGQYTGLKDVHGTRIFEGDVVNCNYFCGVVYFYEGAWCVSEKDKYPEDLYDLINIEVIGNIYDNPELLESKV